MQEESENRFVSDLARKRRKGATKTALVHVRNLGSLPLVSPVTGSPLNSLILKPDRPYTIGRSNDASSCDFVFENRVVSRKHCQILFDGKSRKLYVTDGVISSDCCGFSSFVDEFRKRLISKDKLDKENEDLGSFKIMVSLNGVFVNGVRLRRGVVKELFIGDEVSFVCGREGLCDRWIRVGFVVQGIEYEERGFSGFEERVQFFGSINSSGQSQGTVSSGKGSKRVFALREDEIVSPIFEFPVLKRGEVVKKIGSLLSHCRHILHSDNPVSCIRHLEISDPAKKCRYCCRTTLQESTLIGEEEREELVSEKERGSGYRRASNMQPNRRICKSSTLEASKPISEMPNACVPGECLHQKDSAGVPDENDVAGEKNKSLLFNYRRKENIPLVDCVNKSHQHSCPSPGKSFYLNRLEYMKQSSMGHQTGLSLAELLHPVESISKIFIATFTSDILWFLSCCKIPCHMPVTIACHNTERCWSSSAEARFTVPYSTFPNLVVVFPPFPEAIAFGKDQKRQGIACHHPKLFVLEREESIRVIVTSANLVAKQWNAVTNTIWWQDFPRRNQPDYLSLFPRLPAEGANQGLRSDFAAQLAGFVASLLIDVPSQAHWIAELTNYNFEGATGHLVASVPGIHSYRPISPPESAWIKRASHCVSRSSDLKFLGSVEASVVGLSYLFRAANDSKGAQLKKLALFISKSQENAHGMLEIVLRRNTNVPADANAVSVLVPNPDDNSGADCVQLGFLPQNVAKWVSPLWDIGFFRFMGYVYRDEALGAASHRNNQKVQLLLHVLKGPSISDISNKIQPLHIVALCSLVASIQRCIGIWRLQEVLGQYKWPESQESDFVYSSSSIGSVNAEFLAAFSAAAGKKALQHFDSQESDPEWGCWSPSQELKAPSIRILFPTIETVKNACDGILPSRHILSFSEKTWQKLRRINILHDAIPHPHDRVGYPMHVKVARRSFQTCADSSSFGWVYCGSHNFSAAAWGRLISNASRNKESGSCNTSSSSGSKLHVCNYELGIIFVFPPPRETNSANKSSMNLDDIELPFVVPPPKYGPGDRPATGQAMWKALAELNEQARRNPIDPEATEETMEEIPEEEEEAAETCDYVVEEMEEEKAYAEALWSQVDSSSSS